MKQNSKKTLIVIFLTVMLLATAIGSVFGVISFNIKNAENKIKAGRFSVSFLVADNVEMQDARQADQGIPVLFNSHDELLANKSMTKFLQLKNNSSDTLSYTIDVTAQGELLSYTTFYFSVINAQNGLVTTKSKKGEEVNSGLAEMLSSKLEAGNADKYSITFKYRGGNKLIGKQLIVALNLTADYAGDKEVDLGFKFKSYDVLYQNNIQYTESSSSSKMILSPDNRYSYVLNSWSVNGYAGERAPMVVKYDNQNNSIIKGTVWENVGGQTMSLFESTKTMFVFTNKSHLKNHTTSLTQQIVFFNTDNLVNKGTFSYETFKNKNGSVIPVDSAIKNINGKTYLYILHKGISGGQNDDVLVRFNLANSYGNNVLSLDESFGNKGYLYLESLISNSNYVFEGIFVEDNGEITLSVSMPAEATNAKILKVSHRGSLISVFNTVVSGRVQKMGSSYAIADFNQYSLVLVDSAALVQLDVFNPLYIGNQQFIDVLALDDVLYTLTYDSGKIIKIYNK